MSCEARSTSKFAGSRIDVPVTFVCAFRDGLLEEPVYTRPAEFEGHTVPSVLLSGDHGAVAEWRQAERERRTRQRRPDLLAD